MARDSARQFISEIDMYMTCSYSVLCRSFALHVANRRSLLTALLVRNIMQCTVLGNSFAELPLFLFLTLNTIRKRTLRDTREVCSSAVNSTPKLSIRDTINYCFEVRPKRPGLRRLILKRLSVSFMLYKYKCSTKASRIYRGYHAIAKVAMSRISGGVGLLSPIYLDPPYVQ